MIPDRIDALLAEVERLRSGIKDAVETVEMDGDDVVFLKAIKRLVR